MISKIALNKKDIPSHVAIIMDGNGRWAKKKRLPRIEGHRTGSKKIIRIVRAADQIGIKYLTLFSFSKENWQRPDNEIKGLMDLFEVTIDREIPGLKKNNVVFKVIGDLDSLRKSTRDKFSHAINETKNNNGLNLIIAVNYSGRDELARCLKKIAKQNIEKITEKTIANNLDTALIPDPELLIRTSGELRVSNFLLWQIAYSEIWVTKLLWPDFRPRHLYQAISDYQKRERRFGGVNCS
ncbi:MAG: isoprenyl transferase [Actinobacteria bacterium]|nr:MAG: isoprenyl transferase [Actinomycetota bacterium]